MKARALLFVALLGCGDDRPQRSDASASASDTTEPTATAVATADPGPPPVDTKAQAALEAAFAPGSVCLDPAGLYTSTAPIPTTSGSSGGLGPALSPKCEAYFSKMRRCMEESVKLAPQSTRESVMKSVLEAERQSRESWKALDHGTLDTVCKTALEALDSNPACPP